MRIAIVGDVHYAPIPDNRIDDYINVCLDKITQIANYCNHVIFLGDIFSTPKVDEKYLIPLIDKLAELKEQDIKFYTIVGNHDVYNEMESRLNECSLGVLYKSRLMDVILPDRPIEIKDGNKLYKFHTVPVRYRDAIEYIKDKHYDDNDILLIHHEYETGTNKFTYDDLKGLGCKNIFFGHDHCPLPQGRIIYPEFTVYRCGSLMRNIAMEYNFIRQVYYFIIDTEEPDGKWIYCKNINQQPANIIFKEEKYIRQDYNRKQFNKAMDEYIEKYKQKIQEHHEGKQTKNKLLMSDVLKDLNTPDYDIDLIKKKYEIIGEKFE